jgi:hypothetical protein
MGSVSSHYRKLAADHLRKFRGAGCEARDIQAILARGYKFLAHDAELHDGQPEKSRPRSPKIEQ